MKLPIRQVDAFTGDLFRGNPAAVVSLPEWLPDDLLQRIAAENNLSETAYVTPGEGAFGLRWFTPKAEVDLCGHATLATAFVLFDEGRVRGDSIHFESRSGPLTVRREGDRLVLDFPSDPPEPASSPEGLAEALGASPAEVHAAKGLLALYETEAAVAELKPRFDLLASLDSRAVIATAPGGEVDFVSRFFAPRLGVPEDPVTGSAHCALTPFWSRRLGKKRLEARQISARGGELACEDRGDRVLIGGRAVGYLKGEIEVPSDA